MDGIDTTWNRVPGGADIGKLADDAIAQFNPANPAASVPALLAIHGKLAALPHERILDEKRTQLDRLIQECLGLTVETTVPQAEVVPGEALKLHHTATVRSGVPVRWIAVRYPSIKRELNKAIALRPDEAASRDAEQTLPAGTPAAEGLEVDAEGNVYVTTFGFTPSGPVQGPGQLLVFSRAGRLVRQVPIAGSSANLLGLAFHPLTGALLAVDFGAAQVLAVDPVTGASSVFMTLPALPRPALGTSLNDLTFDRAGNVYVSDSFQGIVWRTTRDGGVATVWVDDPLLRTAGVPPFGANGLRFDGRESALFVANTGNDTIVKIPVVGGPPGGSTCTRRLRASWR